MRAYAILPDAPVGFMLDIDNELEALQTFVRGYIEAVTIFDDLVVICNDEGRLRCMPYCCSILGYAFMGPVLLVGRKGDEFTDLPEKFQEDLNWMRKGLGVK